MMMLARMDNKRAEAKRTAKNQRIFQSISGSFAALESTGNFFCSCSSCSVEAPVDSGLLFESLCIAASNVLLLNSIWSPPGVNGETSYLLRLPQIQSKWVDAPLVRCVEQRMLEYMKKRVLRKESSPSIQTQSTKVETKIHQEELRHNHRGISMYS